MNWIGSVIDLLLPRYCKVCGSRLCSNEEHLCVSCLLNMPRLEFGKKELNKIEQKLLAERSVVRAESLMRYDKESDYSKILYHLKYYNHPDVGFYLSKIAAIELKETAFFEGIDLIVPVPLSSAKLKKRGYNQCSFIASGLASVSEIPIVDDAVSRLVSNSQQAGKGRFQRWENAEGIFNVVKPEILHEKHILIVDDVLTTGATISSMISILHEATHNLRISVFTLAIAD